LPASPGDFVAFSDVFNAMLSIVAIFAQIAQYEIPLQY
jgi:hypothetical protein